MNAGELKKGSGGVGIGVGSNSGEGMKHKLILKEFLLLFHSDHPRIFSHISNSLRRVFGAAFHTQSDVQNNFIHKKRF